GFWAGLGDEDDRTAFVTEGAAHLVGQIFLILVGKKFVAVDKQKKCWRRLPYLGGIKELEAMAMRTDGLPAFDGILEGAVEDGGGNFLLQLRRDVTHCFQQAIEMKTGCGRRENHRRVIKKEQVFLDPFAKFRQRRHFFGANGSRNTCSFLI